MKLPLELPPISPGGAAPIWEGAGFSIGEQQVKVLEYSSNFKGWNDDLTSFHEDTAGDNHFIDWASRQHALAQIKQHTAHVPNPVILEIGCSSGFMLNRICQELPNATVLGADVVYEPLLKLAEKCPEIPLMRFDLLDCPLPDNSVDAVVMLNVLEHIEKDGAALAQVERILKPGGVVIIEVPAGPHLYDPYDKVLMHYRRYKLNDLTKLAEQQGFIINNKSHLGFFIYPGFWLVKQRNKRLLSESVAKQQQLVAKNIRDTGSNKWLHALMKLELIIGKRISYPFGIRCLVTCTKSR